MHPNETFTRALRRASQTESVPKRVRSALALLLARRSVDAPLSAAERELRAAISALHADPIGRADEVAALVGRAMTEASRERAPDRDHPGPARTHRARATP